MNPDNSVLFPYLSGLLGLLLGRVYAVSVHRFLSNAVPRSSLSLALPACDQCPAAPRWYDSLPVLGYVLLRGRCHACHTPISIRYPLIEAATCLWAVLLAVAFGISAQWVVFMALGGILIIASAIDVECYLLPDILTLPGAGVAMVASLLVLEHSPVDAVSGSLVGAGLFWLLQRGYRALCGAEGIGTGDVKLMLMLGAMCGLQGLPVLITVAGVAALLVHLACMVLGRKYALRGMIPFGPFLSLGGMAQVLWGDAITQMLS